MIDKPMISAGTVDGKISQIADYLLRLSERINYEMVSQAYPVGAIYMSMSPRSPEELFGGRWEQIEGRFLLAATDDKKSGLTGGEAQHTLTTAEMPAHSHRVLQANQSGSAGLWVNNTSTSNTLKVSYYGSQTESMVNELTGDGQPHNNMPPYLTVYMWKRTA